MQQCYSDIFVYKRHFIYFKSNNSVNIDRLSVVLINHGIYSSKYMLVVFLLWINRFGHFRNLFSYWFMVNILELLQTLYWVWSCVLVSIQPVLVIFLTVLRSIVWFVYVCSDMLVMFFCHFVFSVFVRSSCFLVVLSDF